MDSFREDALFIRTVARAQGYDFKTYQRFLEIRAQTNDNAQLAKQVIDEVDRSLAEIGLRFRQFMRRFRAQIFTAATFTSIIGVVTFPVARIMAKNNTVGCSKAVSITFTKNVAVCRH